MTTYPQATSRLPDRLDTVDALKAWQEVRKSAQRRHWAILRTAAIRNGEVFEQKRLRRLRRLRPGLFHRIVLLPAARSAA